MCGIAGAMRLTAGAEPRGDVVRAMCDTLQHRGPDDAGVWCDPGGGAVLGHRRLSIVDLSAAGHCPMPNEDGSVWITYNGEVYNHAGIRRDLETRGHAYRSHTDTETPLHLYEDRGADMLQPLRRRFGFASSDTR